MFTVQQEELLRATADVIACDTAESIWRIAALDKERMTAKQFWKYAGFNVEDLTSEMIARIDTAFAALQDKSYGFLCIPTTSGANWGEIKANIRHPLKDKTASITLTVDDLHLIDCHQQLRKRILGNFAQMIAFE